MDSVKYVSGSSMGLHVARRHHVRKWSCFPLFTVMLVCALVTGCSDSDSVPFAPDAMVPPASTDEPPSTTDNSPPDSETPGTVNSILLEPAALYQLDGYDTIDVLRVDLKTDTTAGICTIDDMSGCTLADVNADTDGNDDFKVDIPIHFQAADYADDGSPVNAELRQRGGTSRQFPQKSYRIKLDSGVMLWRNERRLQLNKHTGDQSRFRNKLSFDLMSSVPDLPSLRTQFVNLWIDDGQGPVDYGLFTHVEAVTKEYLKNREWNPDDRIYKAEHFSFSNEDLMAVKLDATGVPLDMVAFEERLSIETGSDDHSPLINMLTAINDPAQSFDSLLDRYFDRENVLMWVTVNFLLGQKDVITHNFFLYNPEGSEKFYFLPWDYDATFYFEIDPPDSFANDALRMRLIYGYARGANSVFLDRYFRLAGMNATIVAAADEMRSGVFSDSTISDYVSRYADVVRPFATRQPDAQYLPGADGDALVVYNTQIAQMPGYVTTNHQVLQSGLGIPMPPTLEAPVRVADQTVFSWSPAYDVTGHSISYDLQVATDVEFTADNIVLDVSGIADAGSQVQYSTAASSLPAGQLFYRVIARASSDPQRLWQVASNTLAIDNTTWLGVFGFQAP